MMSYADTLLHSTVSLELCLCAAPFSVQFSKVMLLIHYTAKMWEPDCRNPFSVFEVNIKRMTRE